MIVPHMDKRISGDDLIADPWVNSSQQKYRSLSMTVVKSLFENMRLFQIGFELQRVVLMHMANTCIPKDEISVLRQVFDSLDVEKDGEIELDEFLE